MSTDEIGLLTHRWRVVESQKKMFFRLWSRRAVIFCCRIISWSLIPILMVFASPSVLPSINIDNNSIVNCSEIAYEFKPDFFGWEKFISRALTAKLFWNWYSRGFCFALIYGNDLHHPDVRNLIKCKLFDLSSRQWTLWDVLTKAGLCNECFDNNFGAFWQDHCFKAVRNFLLIVCDKQVADAIKFCAFSLEE